MPTGRLRSHSTSSPNPVSTTAHSPLLSRGFASLRRSHRHTASATEQRQAMAVLDTLTSSPLPPPPPPPPSTTITTTATATLAAALDSATTTNAATSATNNTSPNLSGNIHEHHIRLVPNVGMTTRCFVFDVIERTLHSGIVLKLGRYSDRNACSDRLSFKSKVVSRCHAELWQEDGKIYIKDSGSSSGTFVNRARLSPANTTSRPYIVQDGDLIQLGVDYKGGVQPMYRAVRMRFEVDRTPSLQQTAFSRVAFRQLKHCLRANIHHQQQHQHQQDNGESLNAANATSTSPASPPKPHVSVSTSSISSSSSSSCSSVASSSSLPSMDVQECCICLYSMGPGQALFIAPCSHLFHYRCLRPLLTQNFPGFSCPLCRTYSDLDATISIEKSDVEHMLKVNRSINNNSNNNNNNTNNSNDTASNSNNSHHHHNHHHNKKKNHQPHVNKEFQSSSIDQQSSTLYPRAAASSASASTSGLVIPAGTSSSSSSPSSSAAVAVALGTVPESDSFDEEPTQILSTTVDDAMTSDTDMDVPSSSPSQRMATNASRQHVENNHGDEDTDPQTFRSSAASPITPTATNIQLRQRKSTGQDGLLSTTLVGSPCPFEMMIHQHALSLSTNHMDDSTAAPSIIPPPPPTTTSMTVTTSTAAGASTTVTTIDGSPSQN